MAKKDKSQLTDAPDTSDLTQKYSASLVDLPDADKIIVIHNVNPDGVHVYTEVSNGLEWSEDSLTNIQLITDDNEDEDEDESSDGVDTPPVIEHPTPPAPVTPVYLTKNLADTIQAVRGFVEAEPKGHLIRIDEPVTVVGEQDEDGAFIITSMAVYQECLPHRAKTTTWVLVYPKGKRLPIKSVVLAESITE